MEKILNRYSFGVGDRFAHQARAQLQAIMQAREEGVLISPVWNKSYREHQIIGSESATTRQEADAAVQSLGWSDSYFVDADHINLSNVDFFIDSCDFFTIDVADYIGQPAEEESIREFVSGHTQYCGNFDLGDNAIDLKITEQTLRQVTYARNT